MLYFHFNMILFWVQDIQNAQNIQDMIKTKNEEEISAILPLHFRSNWIHLPLILWSSMQSSNC